MKYVIFQQIIGGMAREVPVIFPNHLSHDAVAEAMMDAEGLEGSGPIAAGFCNVSADCHGRSETLDLDSRGEADSTTINTYDYLHGLQDLEDLPPSVAALLTNMNK